MHGGESANTLLSDTESDEEEESVYRMLNMSENNNSKHGIRLKKRTRNNRKENTTWLCKGLIVLSLVLNLLLTILLIVTRNTDNEWGATTTPNKQTICPTLPSQSLLESLHPAPSASSSQLSSLSSSSSPSSSTSSPKPFSQPNAYSNEAEILEQHKKQQQSKQQQQHQGETASTCPTANTIPTCGSNSKGMRKRSRGHKEYQNIFADLSPEEMVAAYAYLVKQTDPMIRPQWVPNSCHVNEMELHTPNKTEALLFLDSYGSKPAREAWVMLSCLQLPTPVYREIVVGPLPNPTYHNDNPRRRKSTIAQRLLSNYGESEAYSAVRKVLSQLEKLISESYGASIMNCHHKCITFLPQMTSSAYEDENTIIITAYYSTDFVTINPLDLIFVVKEMTKNTKIFRITNIFYGGRSFNSVQELINAYESGAVKKTRMSFPSPAFNETSVPGTLNLRGQAFPEEPKAGPKSYEPDGKRYSVKGQHVEYLKWSFNMRMSTASGPQIWDVKWGEDRIAYEISLQDIGVIYAGANPAAFFAHLSDSAFGLGNKATGLLPGLDCPEGATFLSQNLFTGSGKSRTLPNSQCVFEHNTERPLRRHRSQSGGNGEYHGGLVDRVLIVRSVIVEYNYDYILDVIFHQNGAIEIKTFATGYVMSQHYYNGEKPFGFRIHENSVGSIHHHVFNYKIDMDIQGTSNRYETLDLVLDERSWPWHHQGKDTFKQISFKHNLRETEMEAILRYNYSQPKYHIVYNDEQKNKFDNHRAYRISTSGFSKWLFPDDSPVSNSRAWAKYEMLTTRRKDTEESSSSIFSMTDGANPHVNVDWYLEDNETITDQDLVFWITVGMHHIPHTEDIPNTPTIGTEASILLTPYNYFQECPSVGSRDSIRVDRIGKKVVMKDYGINMKKQCIPKPFNYKELFSSSKTLYSG